MLGWVRDSIMGAGATSSFPYQQTEEIKSHDKNITWSVFAGKRKDDGEPVTLLRSANPAAKPIAEHALKRLKTLRHPNVLKFIDSMETPDGIVCIATEFAKPLSTYFDPRKGLALSPEEIALGLFQIATALSFLNNDGKILHGNLSMNSVWVTKAGEWKLAGFETCKEMQAQRAESFNLLPNRYMPPDLAKGGNVSQGDVWSLDAWCLGCFIYDCYNGEFSKPQELISIGKIPSDLQPEYKRLLATNPKARLNISELLKSACFNNELVKSVGFLENLALKSNYEKEEFFKGLAERADIFPENISKYKLLPQLMNALQFGSGTSAKVLASMLAIARKLSEDEYKNSVVPIIIKLYSSNERAMRVNLLKNLSSYVQHLDEKLINKDIFPNVKTGFTDTVSMMREWTVKSLLYFIPKLKENTIITQIVPFIPRLQRDPEAAIRTNTVVVIGKTAKHFSNSVREKLLLPTFSRALRDPFVPARKSAIAAFKATAEFYSPSDIAGKILPTITLHTIDPSRDVREVTFSTINLFLEVLVKNSAEMPEPDPNDQSAAAMSAQFDPQSSSAQASESSNSQLDLMGTISSWAIQAAANKLLNNSISSSSTQEQKPLSNQSFDHKPPPAYTFQSETHSKPKNKTVSVGSGWSDDVFLDPADGNDDDITIASLSLSTKKGSSGTSQPQKSVGPQPVDSWSDFDGLNSPTNNQASKTRSLNFDLAIGDDFSDSAADLSFDPFQSISSSSDPVKPLAKASSQSKLSEDDLFADLTKKPYDPLGSRKLKSQQQQQQQASSSFAKPKPSSTAATSSSSSSSKKNASSSKSSDMWEDFLSK